MGDSLHRDLRTSDGGVEVFVFGFNRPPTRFLSLHVALTSLFPSTPTVDDTRSTNLLYARSKTPEGRLNVSRPGGETSTLGRRVGSTSPWCPLYSPWDGRTGLGDRPGQTGRLRTRLTPGPTVGSCSQCDGKGPSGVVRDSSVEVLFRLLLHLYSHYSRHHGR